MCRKVRSMSASSIDQGESSGVREAAVRRALARAEDGKPLDQAEAETLLHARGDDLTALLSYAARGPGRRKKGRWTKPKRRPCCTRGATTSRRSSATRPAPGTPAWPRPGG